MNKEEINSNNSQSNNNDNNSRSSSMLNDILSTPSNNDNSSEDFDTWNESWPTPPPKKIVKKQPKSPQEIVRIFWALFFAWAILFWSFISYIVFNPDDARFFISLWIDPQEVKNYVQLLVNSSFWLITIILSIVTLVFLFSAIFTKKEFAKKKTIATILSIFLLIVLFSEITLWIYLTSIIWATDFVNPNWWIIVRDNDLKNSGKFNNWEDVLKDFSNLIWPITIQFDLSSDAKYTSKFMKITWYRIDFDWDWFDDKVGVNPWVDTDIIYTYNKKKTYTPKWYYKWIDNITREPIEKEMVLPAIWIIWIVKTEEILSNWWWKNVIFDVSEIMQLWKIDFYFEDKKWNIDTNPDSWYRNTEKYAPSRVFNSESVVCIGYSNSQKRNVNCDKVILVWKDAKDSIQVEILSEQDIINPLYYTFIIKFKNPNEASIVDYEWFIDVNTRSWNEEILEYLFSTYWKHKITLNLTEADWNVITVEKEINIMKKIYLSIPSWIPNITTYNSYIRVFDSEWNNLSDWNFVRDLQEYYININIPQEIKFNSNYVSVTDKLYELTKTEWDFNEDWKFEKVWNEISYNFLEDKKHTLVIKYTFYSEKKKDTQIIEEKMVFEAVVKNIYIDLKIKQESEYAPTIVNFDWSATHVKEWTITKFSYDFWEWKPITEWDAIQNYKYNYPWEFLVKFTATKNDWTKETETRKIIVKAAVTNVVINSSVSSWLVGKEIDFNAVWTNGQISSYTWDFWDWTKLSEPTPVHIYDSAWEYNIKLTIIFADWIVKYSSKTIKIKELNND